MFIFLQNQPSILAEIKKGEVRFFLFANSLRVKGDSYVHTIVVTGGRNVVSTITASQVFQSGNLLLHQPSNSNYCVSQLGGN